MVAEMNASVAVKVRDTIGEGPAWDAAAERLLWSDNATGVIHEAKADGKGGWRERRSWHIGRRTAAAIPRTKGGLILAVDTEAVIVDETGETETFARIDADPKLVGFNDAKCDSRGRLWAGTFAQDFRLGIGALYRFDPDGTVTTMIEGVGLSNGLDWSPDDKTFYFCDTFARTVDAYNFDAPSGTLSNRRTLITYDVGTTDGMTVDNEGCLWVAGFGTGDVRRYAADGTLIGRIEVAAPGTTSCAFGGPDGDCLFITSGAFHCPDFLVPRLGFTMEIRDSISAAPDAGALFVCQPGTTGRPATPFAG
jgi:sugar lactone lactonase YvrE